MKFIAFLALAFLATVRSTTTIIHPSKNILCGSGTYGAPISGCGKHNLDGYKMASAKIAYYGQKVTFYNGADCTGIGDYVKKSENCYPMLFTVKCVLIQCD